MHFLSNPASFQEQEQAYLALRTREGRVLSDAAVRQLPFKSPTPGLAKEWTWRRRTFQRFRRYLVRRYGTSPLRLLDLGCGNGWMAHRLSHKTHCDIWAVDVNLPELEQGDRLFARQGLQFVFADVLSDALPARHFDVIVLAASAQYFPNLEVLLTALKRLLKLSGEIHFLDTPFYSDASAQQAAQQRTALYYKNMGAPEMTAFYHHHLWPEAGQKMYPIWSAFLQKIGYLAPFPWVCLCDTSKVS